MQTESALLAETLYSDVDRYYRQAYGMPFLVLQRTEGVEDPRPPVSKIKSVDILTKGEEK